MFEIFNNYKKDKYPRITYYPEMRYISNQMSFNVKIISTYARSVEQFTNRTNNVLYKLISSFNTDISLSPYDYYMKTRVLSKFKGNVLGFVSDLSIGTVYRDQFYKNSYEVFYTLDSELNIPYVASNWRELVPFRIVLSPVSNLNYECRPLYQDIEDSLAVYEVDINLLMMMFYYWAKERRSNSRSTDPSVFLNQFVYPNSLKESMNLVIWNMLTNKLNNPDFDPKTKTNKVYPVYTVDIGYRLDAVIKAYISNFTNTGYLLGRTINSCPTFNYENKNNDEMLYYLRTNINPMYRNTRWLLWVSRLPFFITLLKLIKDKGLKFNLDIFRSYQKDFLAYRAGAINFPNGLPFNIRNDILQKQNELLEIVLPNLK